MTRHFAWTSWSWNNFKEEPPSTAHGLGVGCSPYPVLPATLPQAAALPAVAPALAAARQQRKSQRRGNERCGLRKERSWLPRRRSLDLVLNRPRRARSTTAS